MVIGRHVLISDDLVADLDGVRETPRSKSNVGQVMEKTYDNLSSYNKVARNTSSMTSTSKLSTAAY